MKLEFDGNDLRELARLVAEALRGELCGAVEPLERALNATEVAELLGLHPRVVGRMVATGKIRRVPGTAKLLVPAAEVRRLLAAGGEQRTGGAR